MVSIPPLCILPMRYHSTRLPGKMCMTLGKETLAARGWRIACEAFGAKNCVVSMVLDEQDTPLAEELERIDARVSWYEGDVADVLSRVYVAAHWMRWHPDSVILRYTSDDPWKRVPDLLYVASGGRHPVEFGAEAFTLAMLDAAHERETDPARREHISHALFPVPAPDAASWWCAEKLGTTVLTIDTPEDLAAARRIVEGEAT